MKKLFLALIISSTLFAQKGVGIGTDNPTAMLHVVNPDPTTVPTMKLENLKEGGGSYLMLDDDGSIKKAPKPTSNNLVYFILPSIVARSPLVITQSKNVGAIKYRENMPADSTVNINREIRRIWYPITELSTTFNVPQGLNSNGRSFLSYTVEGIAQYAGTLTNGAALTYSVGVFIDDKLKAARVYTYSSTNATSAVSPWLVTGHVDLLELAPGSHTIKVYASRRGNNTGAPNSLYLTGVPSTAGGINEFMVQAILQLSGVYDYVSQ